MHDPSCYRKSFPDYESCFFCHSKVDVGNDIPGGGAA